jgi:hypothetical protein
VPFTCMFSLSFRFTDQSFYASHHPFILVDLTAYLLPFDPNNIWWWVHIMKTLVTLSFLFHLMFFSGPNILSALCGYYTCIIRPDPYFPKSAHHIHIHDVIMIEISISVIYFLSVYDLHIVMTSPIHHCWYVTQFCFVNPNKPQSHVHLEVCCSVPVSFTYMYSGSSRLLCYKQ